jgi:hypothetical protein
MKHILWKVSNGYLRVPENCTSVVTPQDADQCTVFKTLDEFAKWQPKRKRNRKQKPQKPSQVATASEE